MASQAQLPAIFFCLYSVAEGRVSIFFSGAIIYQFGWTFKNHKEKTFPKVYHGYISLSQNNKVASRPPIFHNEKCLFIDFISRTSEPALNKARLRKYMHGKPKAQSFTTLNGQIQFNLMESVEQNIIIENPLNML